MKIKPADRRKFEALKSQRARAKWLLAKGVTAKLTIDPETLQPMYQAFSAGISLPGFFLTAERAVLKSTQWLAKIAGMTNADGKEEA